MLPIAPSGIQLRLWFDIQRSLAELQRVCVEARAVHLLNQRRELEGKGLEEVLVRVSVHPEQAVDPRFDCAQALSQSAAFVAKHPAGSEIDIVAVRAQLRKQLLWLKARLAEDLTEREVYHCLFPIVIYTDELVNVATEGASTRWEPLQGELYDVDNGGEKFFETIDTLLHKDDTHSLIFEIYFFCLHDGFVGQFYGQPGKIHEYCRRIAERIPVERPGAAELSDGAAAAVTLVPFPWRVYVWTAITVLALGLGLQFIAHKEVQLDLGILDVHHHERVESKPADALSSEPKAD